MFAPAGGQQAHGGSRRAMLAALAATGGTNWPGAGFDPETHVVFVPAHECRQSRCSAWCRRRKASPTSLI